MDENERLAVELAGEVITDAKSRLMLDLRFLDAAICALKPRAVTGGSVSTEGYFFNFYAKHVLLMYRHEPNVITRDYLHTVLHCVFKHSFVSHSINPDRWNLACDIAVENIINELDLDYLKCERTAEQERVLSMLKGNVPLLSAEKIYNTLLNYNLSHRQFEELRGAFFADDHELWYRPEEDAEGGGEGDNDAQSDEQSTDTDESGNGNEQNAPSKSSLSEMWSELSRRAQVDLETTMREWGDKSDSLMRTLGIVNRERYDYTDFLKKFAVRGEAMRISEDEFDYVFYTYGLSLYKNMPLIEPLEYRDDKRIRDFAVVIDTSGSVEGEKVKKFVKKTYNILKQTESFFSRVNIRLIQADAEVKESIKITGEAELEAYIAEMKLMGFGGTDFRAAFWHIDELIENGEFTELCGVLYFTDGQGIYPETMPPYPVAFVFVDKDIPPDVPSWAMKLILEDEEFTDEVEL